MMKQKLQTFIKSELTGWTPFTIGWMAAASAVILGLSLYWRDSAIGIITALTGVWCVILTGLGKRSCFIWGTVNVLGYALVSFQARYYGEVMLNLLYYFPANFIGWFAWARHMNNQTGEVEKQSLSARAGALIYGLTALGVVGYGFVLRGLGGELPFVDSFTTVLSVTAQVLSIRRLREQWIIWIAVDVATVGLWAVNFINGKENLSVLLMWLIYLVNAIIMLIRWNRQIKGGKQNAL